MFSNFKGWKTNWLINLVRLGYLEQGSTLALRIVKHYKSNYGCNLIVVMNNVAYLPAKEAVSMAMMKLQCVNYVNEMKRKALM